MAIKSNFQNNLGLVLGDAYIRVRNVSKTVDVINGGETFSVVNVTVSVFASQDACVSNKDPIRINQYSSDGVFGDNLVSAAYEYLKTLPEFVGAVDC